MRYARRLLQAARSAAKRAWRRVRPVESEYIYKPLTMAVARVKGGCALVVGIDDDRELLILLPRTQALDFADKVLDCLVTPDSPTEGTA